MPLCPTHCLPGTVLLLYLLKSDLKVHAHGENMEGLARARNAAGFCSATRPAKISAKFLFSRRKTPNSPPRKFPIIPREIPNFSALLTQTHRHIENGSAGRAGHPGHDEDARGTKAKRAGCAAKKRPVNKLSRHTDGPHHDAVARGLSTTHPRLHSAERLRGQTERGKEQPELPALSYPPLQLVGASGGEPDALCARLGGRSVRRTPHSQPSRGRRPAFAHFARAFAAQ